MSANTKPSALADSAVYESDNGRLICAKCAGASARYTGRDISGQPVRRVTTHYVQDWEQVLGSALACEMGCTTLTGIAGPDGWPLARAEGGAS